jgi:tetratricopeptide (TPR) repeat protein
MNKITYFRSKLHEHALDLRLNEAAEAGEALIIEYINCGMNRDAAYADDLFNLAWVYDEMGVNERAAALYVESANRVLVSRGDSPELAKRLCNLAALLNRQGNVASAYRLSLQAAAITGGAFGENSPELADALYNLANAAADTERLDEALRLHKEALSIRESAGECNDAVNSLHSLAFLHENERIGEKSLGYAIKAMALAQNALEGPDVPLDEVTTREHSYYSACFYLASLHENRGDLGKAEALYGKALRWAKEQGGVCHSTYLNVASKLANIAANQKKYPEALALYREISENFKQTVGENHLFYANNLRNMALLHKKLREYDEAENLMLASIKIRRTTSAHGEGMDEINADALFLIEMHLQAGQPDKALEMLVYVLMDTDAAKPGYDGLLNALAETFARAGKTHLAAISNAMEELCRRETVHDIIRKWNNWEKG